MQRARTTLAPATALVIIALVAACGGGAPAATPTAAPASVAPATAAPPSVAPPTAATTPTNPATGPASITAPATVEAGKQFDVAWTGPNGDRDYITIVAPGATEWTSEPYFYTVDGSPGKLTAPAAAGPYVLWYVQASDEAILFRADITVTPFQGSLLAPETVAGGTTFEVAWNGPDGPGDYVTIVAKGATRWTNEPYFYTASGGNPGTLQAPIDAGDYEIWYVLGAAETVEARIPIVVTAFSATVEAPDKANRGTTFDVMWTGPDGPGDYITIAPKGSPEGTYLSYCYTYAGPTCTLTAPDESGPFEVRYVTQAGKTLASDPIDIT
jgi:Ca-activated chloride channel family protein